MPKKEIPPRLQKENKRTRGSRGVKNDIAVEETLPFHIQKPPSPEQIIKEELAKVVLPGLSRNAQEFVPQTRYPSLPKFSELKEEPETEEPYLVEFEPPPEVSYVPLFSVQDILGDCPYQYQNEYNCANYNFLKKYRNWMINKQLELIMFPRSDFNPDSLFYHPL